MKASNKETATFTGEGLSNKSFLGFPICCDTFGFTLWLFRRLSRPWWFNLHLFNLDLLAFLVGLGTLAHDHFLSWTLSPRLFGIASRVERTVKGAHFEKKTQMILWPICIETMRFGGWRNLLPLCCSCFCTLWCSQLNLRKWGHNFSGWNTVRFRRRRLIHLFNLPGCLYFDWKRS